MYLRRALLLLAFVACVWTAAVVLTGGFTLGPTALRVSSHGVVRPLLVAAVLGALYFFLYRQHVDVDLEFLTDLPWPPIIAALAAFAALLIGIEFSGFIGAGPDPSGYVSQAEKWVRGELTTPVPEWAQGLGGISGVQSAAPVGYVPDPHKTTLVPVYAPGLPLIMAAFERIGGRDAVFYVVPLLGALAVWMTYILGRRMASSWAGALASVLVLCSPPFLRMLIMPMSDVPAAACWITAIVVSWRARTRDAIVCGIVTGVAILIRPNLVPLAAVPAMLLLAAPEARVRRIVLFGLSVAPAALFIAALNSRWYGSPLTSGYGTLDALYSIDRVGPNITRYGSYFVLTQTPIAFLWLAAPFVRRIDRREHLKCVLVTVVYPLAVLAMYVAYLWPDAWLYLRFLLPALPAVCAGLAIVFTTFVDRVRPRAAALVAVVAVTASMAMQQWVFVASDGLFEEAHSERRFARAVEFANRLPPNAILVSEAYSGTLHFYTGHDVLLWRTIDASRFDRALEFFQERRHPVYFIGDPLEEAAFREYLEGTDGAARFEKGHFPDIGDVFVASDLTRH